MKKMFLTPCLLLGIIFSCQTQNIVKATLIKITPFGSTDKPIDTLLISYDKQFLTNNEDWIRLVLTDKNTFQATVNYVQENKLNYEASEKAHLEEGSFDVTIYNKDLLDTTYILKSHQLSKQYLRQLISMLKKKRADEKLIYELNRFLTRINY